MKDFIELTEIDYRDANYINPININKTEISEYADIESDFIMGNGCLGRARHGVIKMKNGNSYDVRELKKSIESLID